MGEAWVVGTTVLHIAIAAAWFGHKLLVPGDLRRSVAAGPDVARRLVPRLENAERLGIATGLGTLATGLALVFMEGAASVRTPIWVGLGLVTAAIAIGAIIARPASNRLRHAIGAGDTTAATAEARTLSTVIGAESLLWVGALVTMLI
jgi:hypothetical protein